MWLWIACVPAIWSGVEKESPTHQAIVAQGHRLGRHVHEPWGVLLGVAAYILVSVGLGVPVFYGLADFFAHLSG